MILSCLILDDDPAYCELISEYVSKDPRLALQGCYENLDAAKMHLDEEPVDLLFLDIRFPEGTAFDFIKPLVNPPHVILITAYPEYALESYDISALDFLLKPFNEEKFKSILDRAIARINVDDKQVPQSKAARSINTAENYFIIRTDSMFVKIKYEEVLYVEAFSDFVKIYTSKNQVHVTLVNLKNIEKSLPENFLRIHRSYIVNTNHITAVNGSRVLMNEISVPMAKTYVDIVMDKIVGNRLIRR